jgi:hypothetical protein
MAKKETKKTDKNVTAEEQFMSNFFANGGAAGEQKESPFLKIGKDEKSKIGLVQFRFMPISKENKAPFRMYWVHQIKLGDKYVKVQCNHKNFGGDCPICKLRSDVWNTHGKNEGKKFYPKQKFLLNVYVTYDPNNAENEKQIFPFVISNGSNPKAGGGMFDGVLKVIQGDEMKRKKPVNLFNVKTGKDIIYTIDYNGDYPKHTIEYDDVSDLSDQITQKVIESQPLFDDVVKVEMVDEETLSKYVETIRSHYKLYTKSDVAVIDTKTTESTQTLSNGELEEVEEDIPDIENLF